MHADDTTWGFPNPYLAEGSAPYYVARFSPPARRAAVANVLAFVAHLDRVVDRARDPGVARLKLDWWREETAAMLGGTPRHPLASAIAADIRGQDQLNDLLSLLDATETRILGRRANDAEAFYTQCATPGGATARLLLGPDATATERQAATPPGAYVYLVTAITRLAADTRQGRCPFSADMLGRHGITEERILDDGEQPALQSLLRDLLEGHPFAGPGVPARSLDPVHRLVAQADALERRIRRNRFAINRRPIQLSPLVLLWHAWRGR